MKTCYCSTKNKKHYKCNDVGTADQQKGRHNSTQICKEEEEKEEEEEKHFGRLATFWFATFTMLLVPLGVSFNMKTLKDE